MSIIQICPVCASPGLLVSLKVVSFFTGDSFSENDKFHACVNESCRIAYFNQQRQYKIDQLHSSLWYKNNGDDVPICYCSKLTRGEILDAVKSGCNSIDAVQEFCGKDRTGFCETENPVGGCCREVFLYTIQQVLSG